jgi:hypothetical protein
VAYPGERPVGEPGGRSVEADGGTAASGLAQCRAQRLQHVPPRKCAPVEAVDAQHGGRLGLVANRGGGSQVRQLVVQPDGLVDPVKAAVSVRQLLWV